MEGVYSPGRGKEYKMGDGSHRNGRSRDREEMSKHTRGRGTVLKWQRETRNSMRERERERERAQ